MVIAVPIVLDDTLVLGTGFVVENLEHDYMVMILETMYDSVVDLDEVLVLLGLEDKMKDDVDFTMIGDHDVLVVAAEAGGGRSQCRQCTVCGQF